MTMRCLGWSKTQYRLVFIILSLLTLNDLVFGGYLGKNQQDDPQQLICFLPTRSNAGLTALDQVSITLFFNAPFRILSELNLDTGLSGDGYTVLPRVSENSANVRIGFTNRPVPVCLAVSRINSDREPLQFLLENSYIRRLNVQLAWLGGEGSSHSGSSGSQGIAILHVNNTGSVSASELYMAGLNENRLTVRRLASSQTPDSRLQNYLNGVAPPQQMLLLELHTRYMARTDFAGVGEYLFQHLLYEDGFRQSALTVLMALIKCHKELKQIVLSENPAVSLAVLLQRVSSVSGSGDRRVAAWGHLLPYLGNVSQQQGNQILALLSGSLDQVQEGVERIVEDEDLVSELAASVDRRWDYKNPRTGRRYQRIDRGFLGKGGEGAVVKVIDDQGNEWAMKEINLFAGGSLKSIARLQSILDHNKLNSEYIVKPESQWSDGRTIYQVMKLYPEGDLQDLIDTRFPEVQENLQTIISEVVFSVALAHAQQVTHRDIKPSNYLVSYDKEKKTFRAHLTDLGCMREMQTPNDMTTSIVGTAIMLGQHTSSAFYNRQNYSPMGMDWELLAMSLFVIATGEYLLADEVRNFAPIEEDHSPEEAARNYEKFQQHMKYRDVIYGAISRGAGHQPGIISKNLKKLWARKYSKSKYQVKTIPEPVLNFIAELLAMDPTKPKEFFTLLNMMQEHDYFQPFLKASREAQVLIRHYKKKTDNTYQQIRERLRHRMDVEYVEPDGNCLPAAIAGAINAVTGSERTHQGIREELVRRFRGMVRLFDEIRNHPEQFDLPRHEAIQLYSLLRMEFASLTGIGTGQMDSLPDNGSTDPNGWLEPGLLALLPLLGIDVNVYAPHHVNGLDEAMQVYDQTLWQQTPLLSYYLQLPQSQTFVPPPPEVTHTITLIQNGAYGESAGAGHYYYGVVREAPTEANDYDFCDINHNQTGPNSGAGCVRYESQ